MKTKAIVATLFIAAAASANAHFASPYPRKAVAPDESGYWIVVNGYPWSRDVESEPERRIRPMADRTGERSPLSEQKDRTSRNGLPGCRGQES